MAPKPLILIYVGNTSHLSEEILYNIIIQICILNETRKCEKMCTNMCVQICVHLVTIISWIILTVPCALRQSELVNVHNGQAFNLLKMTSLRINIARLFNIGLLCEARQACLSQIVYLSKSTKICNNKYSDGNSVYTRVVLLLLTFRNKKGHEGHCHGFW